MAANVVPGTSYSYRPMFGTSATTPLRFGDIVRVVRPARFNAETTRPYFFMVEVVDTGVTDIVSGASLHELDRS
jgi:hypothetical protein